ncbi:hypothetical protein BATDEDRAFT_19117 [Batrachochytrium dendrobatidis JAM81]|uniref:Ubiquitin-activating enzyme E1 1 n=1 Tax=Batrachochytrium dendrobatidis (strain JAM81 / FGSC 10211) TaxID=684364 RepID=F4NY58_BATDJ|nr:E1 ubiquitin-activating protein UBA1 [Batrachochytrium dendrobatidis JAM81]EGF81957.1 hypothetical protein BATDEDRAFT_19117 [Batrachochytrium dendrobatidis JAM81]|eukprot:XP_006677214.1 hypothetical protein BATDEDRAFT_19117 [Batrachochytrium dendrobatidis JAM81]
MNPIDMDTTTTRPQLDEGLYSRQLYVLGRDAMEKMSLSNVLIIGLKGLGIEIAKNVVLAGVKSVTLHDSAPVQLSDLSSQFFLHDSDVGQPRDKVSCPRLAELNAYVPITVHQGALDEAALRQFQVVVLTESSLETQLAINTITHKHGIKFISANVYGLFAATFNDFGDHFVVVDQTGEEPLTGMIASVGKDSEGVVASLEEQRHGLADGDYVTFTEVQGMTELNGIEPRQVTTTGPYTFKIGNTSTFGTYKSGGIFKQVKMPKTISFKSLAESLKTPEFLISDFAKFDRPAQLHVGFQALDAFRIKHKQLPRPRSSADAAELMELAKVINKATANPCELDEKLIHELSFQACGDLPPMCAVMGGLIAQEVLKACSGKFTPIYQFLYFDSLESLPTNISTLSESEFAPKGTRYDNQIAVYGAEFHAKIANSRQFLVGAGAIGCEMLKNWALMGLGTGAEGSIHVTDMDTIEKSNLNRQFLFRPWDVSKLKSTCAATAVEAMNPHTKGKIVSLADRVGADTEHVFNDVFWERLTGVTNALDNVDARKYVDRRCVFFSKPLLESGTLGTKGNTQVVIPHLTESYSSSQDPPEKSIPICTLKNFPNAIEHTIQWARDMFEGMFRTPADNVNLYLSQPNYIDNLHRQGGNHVDTLQSILAFLVTARPLSFDECIVWARMKFEEHFNNTIQQLLYNFPKDSVTSTGMPFWSGPKRAPTAVVFDLNDPLHFNFVLAAANLHAFNYGLKGETDIKVFQKVLTTIIVPEFVPKSGVKIAVSEAEAAQQSAGSADTDLDKIVKELPAASTFAGVRLKPVEFEKDDDTNFHIDFITAASNLRASNYAIEHADRSKTKFIAGRIIPAIATTTSLVTGLICLELYKVIDGKRKMDDFKNGFVNLALPFFGFSEPIAAPIFKYNDVNWTLWDRFDIKGDVTLQQLFDIFKNEHGLEITMLSCGARMLYSFFMPPKKVQERLASTITKVIEEVTKKPFPTHTKSLVLEACVNDKTGEDADIPYIRVVLE